MEYLNYLIYPIAGFLAILAIGGLNTRRPVVIVASVISLVLNGYAIIAFIWWPIAVSFVSDFAIKAIFGDPGAPARSGDDRDSDALDAYLLGAFPLIMGSLHKPAARVGAQVFILGMVDMKRSAEELGFDEFVRAYDALLDRHDLQLSVPTEEFVEAVGRVAPARVEVANLMREGATSIKRYIVESDLDAVSDLGRAVMYAEQNASIFAALPGSSSRV